MNSGFLELAELCFHFCEFQMKEVEDQDSADYKNLIDAISARFPEIGQRMAKRAAKAGFPDFLAMIEEFSDATTEAFRREDLKTAKNYLDFMSIKLEQAQEEVRKFIDVYYVETLMFGMNAKQKRAAWKIIPLNLRQLYVNMWGDPMAKN